MNFDGRCIFCGDKGLSKEHLWAKWLRPFIQAESDAAIFGGRTPAVNAQGDKSLETQFIRKPGNIHSHKVRVVCEKCNNEWMSEIQEKVRPTLLPLMKAETNGENLTEDQSKTLASWVMMFNMVIEFKPPIILGVSEEQRSQFFKEHSPTNRWMIWVGRGAKTNWKYYHSAFAFYKEEEDPAPNSQFTTFRVGDLIFHSYSSTKWMLNDGDPLPLAMRYNLLPVWPRPPIGFGGIHHTLSGEQIARFMSYCIDIIDPDYKYHPDMPFSPYRIKGQTPNVGRTNEGAGFDPTST